jgi:hypothetical protein
MQIQRIQTNGTSFCLVLPLLFLLCSNTLSIQEGGFGVIKLGSLFQLLNETANDSL